MTGRIMHVAESGKAALTTATATVVTGTGSWLEYIPEDIGKLGVLVGIMLSVTLIVVHIRREIRDAKRFKKEIEGK